MPDRMQGIKPDLGRVTAQLRRGLGRLDRIQRRRPWLAVPVAVVRKSSEDQGGNLAALIAYYGFLGVFPLLLVFAAILSLILAGDQELQNSVLHSVERSFPALSQYLQGTIRTSQAALGIGLAGAAWAGLGVTRATEQAMNTIWDIPLGDRPGLWWGRARGLLMLVILGATFLASDAVSALRGGGGVLGAAGDAVSVTGSLVLNLVLFGLAFQVLTNRHLSWRSVAPGAAAGAVGWTALLNLGSLFVSRELAHASRLYGSVGFVIALTAWIYLGARLVIYCAELNVVLEYHLWPRSLSGSAGTDADRRALLRQVREAQRSAGETIEVTWSKITGAGTEPGGPRTGGPEAGVPAAVAQLQLLDDLARERESTRDPSRLEELARARRAAADQAVKALVAAARRDPDLGCSLEALGAKPPETLRRARAPVRPTGSEANGGDLFPPDRI
ncbi:MAG TPA: YihY/virulence factor BrkB family protein [Acidimicrobiales bacterium]|nr:YihY/virulence factor BrkB family protein [Acidimicrobiales bacterium]